MNYADLGSIEACLSAPFITNRSGDGDNGFCIFVKQEHLQPLSNTGAAPAAMGLGQDMYGADHGNTGKLG